MNDVSPQAHVIIAADTRIFRGYPYAPEAQAGNHLRGSGEFSALASLVGVSLCSLASAAPGGLLGTVSHASISGALLSLCLLTAFRTRK